MNVIQTNFKYKNPLVPLNPDKVLFIVLHHPDAAKASPEDIHRWHLEAGYAGFGYNEYIRKDGTVYIGRGDNIGAQCKNNNSKSYGICCEGDYGVETAMPQAQFDALIERLKYHKGRFKNLVGIEPHSKFNATSCPGKHFPLQKIYDTLEPKIDAEEQTFYAAIARLQNAKVINSPMYWIDNAKEGLPVKGEYARSLIIKMGDYISRG
jgi:N-acetylmuramoyl-L-alanine amidase